MEDSCVHHVEFGVSDGEALQRRLAGQYNFSLCATRVTQTLKQWVLKSGTATVLLTQQVSEFDSSVTDPYHVEWKLTAGDSQTESTYAPDSVFNVALKVKDLKLCVQKLTRSNVEIVRQERTVKDQHGEISYAIVKSCIGNVVHTIIQDDGFKGTFLPEFIDVKSSSNYIDSKLITHFDHVTFACACGQSEEVLDWYSQCFGMRRFLINREEDQDAGFVIDTEDIGLRLKAFEYWKCAETGLSSGPHPESIKFVIAEALPNQGPNQVDMFLQDHGGEGIQHVGLHTTDIVQTVAQLKQNGVEFAEPPYTYYTEVGKYEEICDIGQDVEVLKENGILVDAEADPGEIAQDDTPTSIRYLMQKFTKPLFDRNTFFLEVIHRVGARGFGSGNITALWRSVQAYMNSQEQQKS